MDSTCLSETYLEFSILIDDDNLKISGYDLSGADHPSNTKQGGVCIYYGNSLPLKILGVPYLQECDNFKIWIGGKLCKFLSLYRLPSQWQDDFEAFAINFELNIDIATTSNPFLTVNIGDFNTGSNLWFKGEKKIRQ